MSGNDHRKGIGGFHEMERLCPVLDPGNQMAGHKIIYGIGK